MRIGLACLLLVTAACGAPASPTKTAREFAALLDAGHYDAAWAMLSEESRAKLDRSELERRMASNPEERRLIVAQLSREVAEERAEARYLLDDGREVRLVLEDGRWKLDGAILDVYSQATPRLAIASFVRAVENKRYDVLLRFVPRAYRTPDLTAEVLQRSFEVEMRDEIAAIVDVLRESANEPIEENGDRARLSLGPGDAVLLVREDGAWKIEDIY